MQAGGSSAPSCNTSGTKTVLSTAKLRLFRVATRKHAVTRTGSLYGCLAGVGKRFRLDKTDDPHEPETAVLVVGAGRFAATALEYHTPVTEVLASVEVTDLRTGKRHSALALASYAGPTYDRVTALVLNRSGSAAWIAVNSHSGAPNEGAYELRAQRVGSGAAVELDSGADVAPGSLALSADGRTLYWRKAGTAQTAPMP